MYPLSSLLFLLLLYVQPELYVSQTGNTSIVNIQPSASDIKDALRYPHNCLQHCDITALPRTAAPTNFGHDAYNSQVLTSNVVSNFLRPFDPSDAPKIKG